MPSDDLANACVAVYHGWVVTVALARELTTSPTMSEQATLAEFEDLLRDEVNNIHNITPTFNAQSKANLFQSMRSALIDFDFIKVFVSVDKLRELAKNGIPSKVYCLLHIALYTLVCCSSSDLSWSSCSPCLFVVEQALSLSAHRIVL